MATPNTIPTLAKIALQYGTINKDQYRHLLALQSLKQKENHPLEFETLLLTQKFATYYQIELLKLIQDYHIVKKRGEEFGKIAVEKGFATPLDIQQALEVQKKEFKRARIKKLIGDILVESRVITTRQKNLILKEQMLLDQQANHIFASTHPAEKGISAPSSFRETRNLTHGSDLSDYEKKFLETAALDKEFAAILLERRLASEQEVEVAQKIQEEAFETEKSIQLLGDIMVSLKFITEEQKNIVLKEQGRGDTLDSGDAVIQVTLSQDHMEARVKIDTKSTPRPSVAELKEALKPLGIRHGIYPDALLQGLLTMERLEFTIARSGGSPLSRRDPLSLETHLTEKGEKRKGDLLAGRLPGQTPWVQTNLFGQEIQQADKNYWFPECGTGTRPSHDGSGILAAKTGIPSLSIQGKLFVHPIIHVLEDADQKYGPLEAYANLNISGVLTGAYPITAGTIRSREIRGARIESIGPIHAEVGITDTFIRSQGDIHARYLHNCHIETFGNLYIENEIFDSTIRCSGSINSPKCRVIASHLFAKKGIKLAGAGSEKTRPCTLTAGGEHHVLELSKSIYTEIDHITRKLDTLKEKMAEQETLAQKVFQKMIELKIYHDRAKNRKQTLEREYKPHQAQIEKEKLENILNLIATFENRIGKSIASLKELNQKKKDHDQKKLDLETKIILLTPKIESKTQALEKEIFLVFDWTRSQENSSKIEINGTAFQGTIFNGAFSSMILELDTKSFSLHEVSDSKNQYHLEFL